MTPRTVRRSTLAIVAPAALAIASVVLPSAALATDESVAARGQAADTGKAAESKPAEKQEEKKNADATEKGAAEAAEVVEAAEVSESNDAVPAPGFNTLEDIYPADCPIWPDETEADEPSSEAETSPGED